MTDGEGAGPSIAGGVDRVFRRLLAATAVMALVLAGGIAYILGVVRPEQQRYALAGRALEAAHTGLVDEETGLRGYLLAQDTRFLQPYQQGRDTVTDQDAALDGYVGSDPTVASPLLEMRVAQQAWVSEWAEVAARGQAPTSPAALDAFLDRGKALFDSYRAREVVLGDRVAGRRDSLQSREGVALAAGLAAVVALGAALVVLMARQRRALRAVVVEPVARIVAATEGIARGDLDSELTLDGPSEFRRIAVSIDLMRDALGAARDRQQAAQARIAAQARQLHDILAMSREIAGSLNLRYVLQSVVACAAGVSGFPEVTVWLAEEDGVPLVAVQTTSEAHGGGGDAPDAAPVEIGIGLVGRCVRFGRAVTDTGGGEPSVEVHTDRPLLALAVPLVVGARVAGAIEFASPEPHVVEEGSLAVLETLATHAAAAIEAARLHGRTEELAQTDALTGLANRRRLDEDLAVECERSARYGRPLALVMFDVDHFKSFNDQFGHVRGDEILQELAGAVRAEVRTTDTVYRYGGEEFAVLARETDAEDAVVLAERLRDRIERHFSARGSPRPVTASFGVGTVPPAEAVPARILARADAALYRAKEEGRNRVCGPVDAGVISL